MLDSNKLINAAVGDRIECQGDFGTIKYIGEVDGHAGCWLGIDWDNRDRGKHNGTVNGKSYFVASSPTSGSFVRPGKVELGQTVIAAITSRYGQKDDELTAKYNQQQLLRVQQQMNAPFLQFVGFDKITDKQSNYNDLKVITVRLMSVNCLGEPYQLQQLCPNIIELDISKNLINTWGVVFEACEQLENLSFINVSENRLQIPENIADYNFTKLRTLACGSMDLSWPDLIRLTKVFPNLEELIAPNNAIKTLDVDERGMANLKILDLEGNRIVSWDEVNKLGRLPSLQVLMLSSTELTDIHFPPSQEMDLFGNLQSLYIQNNSITSWTSVNELNKLPKLESLKCNCNPVFDKESVERCSQMIVAMIGNLKLLNGVDIIADRKGAEYDYIKQYGLEWISVKDEEEKRDQFLSRHSRYLELIEKHGEPEESELKVQVKTLQVSLIEVRLINEQRSFVKKLPPTMQIQKLIMLVQRLFGLSDRPRLLYTSREHPDIEIPLEDECKELGVYSIQNGDCIVIRT